MTDLSERAKQYAYNTNSNLVIQRDRSDPLNIGPTDEVKTLSNSKPEDIQSQFGSYLVTNKQNKNSNKRTSHNTAETKKSYSYLKKQKTDILDTEITEGYTPTNISSKKAYSLLLHMISLSFSGESHELIKSCTDMILEIIYDDRLKLPEKRIKIEKLILSTNKSKIDDSLFDDIINVSQKITDFDGNRNENKDIDNNINVPINFPDESEMKTVIQEEDENSDLEFENSTLLYPPKSANSNLTLSTTSNFEGVGEKTDNLRKNIHELNLKEIDAFWLQKGISKYFSDPLESQEKAKAVLEALSNDDDKRFCENNLVELLGFHAFDFIKKLMNNRLEIVYCVKLANCSGKEKQELEKEMSQDKKLRNILKKINLSSDALTNTTEKFRDDIRTEVANLKDSAMKLDDSDDMNEYSGLNNSKEVDAYKKRINIDLESIKFKNGGHTMTNKEWSLPDSAKRITRKGYIEIYIPYKEKSSKESVYSKKISELPGWTHASFKSNDNDSYKPTFSSLNHVQTKCYKAAFHSNENMLLCAPTGAGKTVVAQLCMLREIGLNRDTKNNVIKLNRFKIIYIAPMKSLVREMVDNFSTRFKPYGITVNELSGDQQLSQQQIEDTQIIITTPEKWDIITRKSGVRTYLQMVKLIIFDEIHLIHDNRGPVLEAIVARIIRQTESTKEKIRMVGLSATLPNFEDVSMFLRVPQKHIFYFDQGYRPCPLTQCFVGVANSKPFKQMELMNNICYEKVISQRKKSQQILIFVHSRKETYNTGRFIRDKANEKDQMNYLMKEGVGKSVLVDEVEHLKNEKLKELLPDGIAIHHAGLNVTDRRVVEDLFMDRHISVLVSTATLAWGVNLPAHCVIIKGTQVYSPEKSKWIELSMLDVMQMTGRAGRPGLDSYGEAFILTTQKELKYYMSLLTEQLPIESQLISKLPDNLNAEIVLGTIKNVHEAIDWLYYTYLYIRMLSAPELYGIEKSEIENDPDLYQRRIDIINSAALIIDKAKLIRYDKKGATFQVTQLGKIASYFYLTHQSISSFSDYMKPSMSDIEIFRVFSLAQEFNFVTIREEEKLELSKLLDKVPIPVKENTDEPSAKVNVLLQAYISRLKMEGYQLRADMQYITQSASRLMRALFTIALKNGWSSVAKKCLRFAKSIDRRIWAIESPIRQFSKGIASIIFRKIERKEFAWERWLDLKPHEIGTFIDHTEQGNKVYQAIHYVPRLSISGQIQPITRTILRMELTLEMDFAYNPKHHYSNEPFWVIVEDVDGETIVYYEYFLLSTQVKKEQIISCTIPIYDPLPPQYFIRVFSDRFLGSETMMPISFTSLILPEKFPPPTELLDFTAQPVSGFKNIAFSKLYLFDHFNPIQTQTYKSIYKTNENVLVCSPTSSGKTVCAELAIIRMLEDETTNNLCVYLAPNNNIANSTYQSWIRRFGKIKSLDISIVLLTGDISFDQKLINIGNIIVTSAENWNPIQRRWRRRKAMQNISLFIVDEMHMLTYDKGYIFEECISRMQYIVSQTENPVRFIGLSASVSNAQDLGEWIGCKFNNIFNFSPNSRPVSLSLNFNSFDINHFDSRHLAMIKPAYQEICQNSKGKPVIIFVPSRKFARKVAVDFMHLSENDKTNNRFLRVSKDDMESELKHINNDLLKLTIKKGIAFYHDRMTLKEKHIISSLIKAQAIQVVIAEYSTCWTMSINSYMVIIMGTKYFNGTIQNYSNYAVIDILQMIGKASRPLIDSDSKVLIMCTSSRQDFLKKFLYEPFPVESQLDNYLADYMNAEIVNETIENIQEAIDFITWTFLYRRLHQNPNFYNLFGTSNLHISDYLSKLTEEILDSLEQASCIKRTEDSEYDIVISALNLGHIAAYYNIQFITIETFTSMLNENIILRNILEVLACAEEFSEIPLRKNENVELQKMDENFPLNISNPDWNESRTKVYTLFQAHFSRVRLNADLAADRNEILKISLHLLFGIVDVISSNAWLKPALNAMELCQMITQGMWDNSPLLYQLPHMNKIRAEICKKRGIDSPLDLFEENEDDLKKLLSLTKEEFSELSMVANDFPNPDVKFEIITDKNEIYENKSVKLKCSFVRDEDDEDRNGLVPKVFSPRYPSEKTETWWLLVGDTKANKLLGIKRIPMIKKSCTIILEFVPYLSGKNTFTLYLMTDSFIGVDQEYEFNVDVKSKTNKKISIGKNENEDK